MQTLSESTTEKYLRAGGIQVHYHDVGTVYPVIMLHGAGPGASAWSNFVFPQPGARVSPV